ncbi:glycosyltransferase family 4 protein [Yinghuangia soli]|uniref:D-inositol 3-phosphate glycosyltransferase n=1 Tax=Yinghuangia soli TaxID=2908204 RepID=A0AA41Q3H5_9ACTN|nr:glycosyltransferase family 4 protein [Yinghuangia soli]MCF2529734.1 glycosyltransferase family 4 protein [Yinghuangia soli]
MRSPAPRSDVLHVITDRRRRGAQTFAYELHQELRARGVASEIAALADVGAAGDGSSGSLADKSVGNAASIAAARLDLPVLGPGRLHPRTLAMLRYRAGQARVVVAHGSSTLPACAISLMFARTPFIYVNIGDPRHWAASPSRKLRVGAMLRRAAAVASVSTMGRDLLVGRYDLPGEWVRAIPNGRRPEAYPRVDAESRAQARKELGIADDALVVAVVGALGPEKRVDLAVEAFARFAETPAPGHASDAGARHGQLPAGERLLLVAGDGTERDQLARIAAERVPGRVRFLGTVDDAARVYRASDALLLTSDSEGVPGVLVEAGLSGIPAVATDVGFVRDVVLDGRTGALAAPGDPGAVAAALRRVLADREALGAAAYEHCTSGYAMPAVVDAWQDLLQAVAGRAGVVDKA